MVAAGSLHLAVCQAGCQGDAGHRLREPPHEPGSPLEEIEDDDDAMLEELFLLENAAAQGAGELQVTTAVAYATDDEGDRVQADLVLEYGYTDRLQFELGVPYLWLDPSGMDRERGLSDVELGVLYNLYSEGTSRFSIAFEVSLPTGEDDDDLGEGEVEYEPNLLYSTTTGDVGLFANLGGEYSDGEALLTYGVGLARRVEDWVFTGEIGGARGEGEDEVSLALGALWHGWEDTELGIGVPLGISRDAEDWGVVVMWTREF